MEPSIARPKPVRPAACPACKSHNVNTVWYGMPAGGPDLVWPPNVTAGGCTITGLDPNRLCLDCGHEWSTPASAQRVWSVPHRIHKSPSESNLGGFVLAP